MKQKRTLVFGDIHGGLRALQQLFERAKITTDDQLIFLGDYVDGWSESSETVQFLIEIAEKQECIFIKGFLFLMILLFIYNNFCNIIYRCIAGA